jgi:hypothetical protein
VNGQLPDTARVLTLEEVTRASRLVFGAVERTGLPAQGWEQQLRRAFHRRVMSAHPDRALALGRSEAELAEEFRALTEAHALLEQLSAGLAKVQRPAPRPPSRAAPDVRDHFASGATIPARRLRLAELLYHEGLISWRSYSEAVAWQRQQRPAIGQLAVEWGHLTHADVRALLAQRHRERAFQVRFGEYAVNQGMLTGFQRLALLGRQRRLQQPIGAYFIERGLLDEAALEAACDRMFRHNGRL